MHHIANFDASDSIPIKSVNCLINAVQFAVFCICDNAALSFVDRIGTLVVWVCNQKLHDAFLLMYVVALYSKTNCGRNSFGAVAWIKVSRNPRNFPKCVDKHSFFAWRWHAASAYRLDKTNDRNQRCLLLCGGDEWRLMIPCRQEWHCLWLV